MGHRGWLAGQRNKYDVAPCVLAGGCEGVGVGANGCGVKEGVRGAQWVIVVGWRGSGASMLWHRVCWLVGERRRLSWEALPLNPCVHARYPHTDTDTRPWHVQLCTTADLGAPTARAVMVHPTGAVPGVEVPHELRLAPRAPVQVGVPVQLKQLHGKKKKSVVGPQARQG